jgi:hypothetical protein
VPEVQQLALRPAGSVGRSALVGAVDEHAVVGVRLAEPAVYGGGGVLLLALVAVAGVDEEPLAQGVKRDVIVVALAVASVLPPATVMGNQPIVGTPAGAEASEAARPKVT